MAFDVSKFLALTAVIAGTGYACTNTTDPDEPEGGAGSSGSSSQSSGGDSGNQGGAADPGNGGAAGSKAGEGGAPAGGAGAGAGGAGAGGESLGGAAGDGGEGGAHLGECLSSLELGGAGGADSGVEPSLEGLCMDFFNVECAASPEDYAPSYKVCEGVKERGQPAVAVAVADCIKALSVADACDDAKVAACFTSLAGRGCTNPASAPACVAMKARTGCDVIDLTRCEKIADLVNPDMFDAFTECMDPSIEGFYNPDFVGTCVERLDSCAGVFL